MNWMLYSENNIHNLQSLILSGKCRRVVEMSTKQVGKQPIWISSAVL